MSTSPFEGKQAASGFPPDLAFFFEPHDFAEYHAFLESIRLKNSYQRLLACEQHVMGMIRERQEELAAAAVNVRRELFEGSRERTRDFISLRAVIRAELAELQAILAEIQLCQNPREIERRLTLREVARLQAGYSGQPDLTESVDYRV